MKCLLVGLGIQGKKRAPILGENLVATVDPINRDADFRTLEEVPLNIFDAALVCTPDEVKPRLLQYLLSHGKHVLVEKPLVGEPAELTKLAEIGDANSAVLYTAD